MSSIPAAKDAITDALRKGSPATAAKALDAMFSALADKIDALEEENAKLRAELDATPSGWVKDSPAPSIDPKGPTITHAQLCRLSQAFHRADGTYDNDGFAINEWLKHRLALSAEVASLISKGGADV